MPTIQLYARNNTENTITFNTNGIKWELPPLPDDDYIMALPWEVATASGFDRLWDAGDVTVSLDRNFTFVIAELPLNQSDHAFVYPQPTPVTTVDVTHNLGRAGPVLVSCYSLDYAIQWDGVTVGIVNENTCRLGFEDPTAFIATIA